MKKKYRFTMPFKPATIEHLGLKLYVSLPPVISEMVSNAWDADATRVEITVPEGDIEEESEVVMRDYGSGMDEDMIQNAYLPIGRNCREDLKRDTSAKGRPLMGRKGLGKLAAFGVASEIDVRTIKDGNAIAIRMNYERMKTWPKGTDYEPEIIEDRTGPTREPTGTEIRIRKLRRRMPIAKGWITKELARRFAVIGDGFQVLVNGEEIRAEDRRLAKDCTISWVVDKLPGGAVLDEGSEWKLSGWIGLLAKAAQTERGIDIFTRGKIVEKETMFDLKTTNIQFARAYVVGEVHADFLDDNKEDNISTARNSVHWESIAGQKLQAWGQNALKFVFDEWLKQQRKEKEVKVRRIDGFDEWRATRNAHEQRIADKLVKVIVDDEKIDPEAAGPMLEMIKTNIELTAFRDLVDEIESSGANVQTLLKLFEEWRVIEAREHLTRSDGRLEIIEKLTEFIEKGALEVKQIQPLFEMEGWLVDPAWTHVTGQTRYTDLLRKQFPEPKDTPEEDRRMDILGYDPGGAIKIVELKRPKKKLTWKDLEQIERYVEWARANLLGTGAEAPKYISGLLIVGDLNSDKDVQSKMARLAGSDIRVETFDSLVQRARKIFGQVDEQLKRIAPEHSREARKKARAKKQIKKD